MVYPSLDVHLSSAASWLPGSLQWLWAARWSWCEQYKKSIKKKNEMRQYSHKLMCVWGSIWGSYLSLSCRACCRSWTWLGTGWKVLGGPKAWSCFSMLILFSFSCSAMAAIFSTSSSAVCRLWNGAKTPSKTRAINQTSYSTVNGTNNKSDPSPEYLINMQRHGSGSPCFFLGARYRIFLGVRLKETSYPWPKLKTSYM